MDEKRGLYKNMDQREGAIDEPVYRHLKECRAAAYSNSVVALL